MRWRAIGELEKYDDDDDDDDAIIITTVDDSSRTKRWLTPKDKQCSMTLTQWPVYPTSLQSVSKLESNLLPYRFEF